MVNHPNRNKQRRIEIADKAQRNRIGILHNEVSNRYEVYAETANKVMGEFKTLKEAENGFDDLVLSFSEKRAPMELPWTLQETTLNGESTREDVFISDQDNYESIAIMMGNKYNYDQKKANAEFIVRAVNCHEDLMEAIKLLLPYAKAAHKSGGIRTTSINGDIKVSEAALAKAGE